MKTIVGIFAHPDDEALGPGGTIAKLALEGNTIYLICVTNGNAAKGHLDFSLGEIRKKELQASSKILGVKEVFFLEFDDGSLSNNIYHIVAEKIKEKLLVLKPEIIITFEPQGVSGHLDHIAISMITSFIVQKLSFVKEIWQYCVEDRLERIRRNYFIYFPPGYKRSQIDKIVDTKNVWGIKKKAMLQHTSQIKDVLTVMGIQQFLPKEEFFLVKKVHIKQ
jgi:LmbE family N-acetylglucosaminyl deacetylase